MTGIRLRVNGKLVADDVPSRLSLADFLRERRNLTGTHLGCEHGVCGACTILLDGEPARACLVFAVACDDREVRTIEGFDGDNVMTVLRHALPCDVARAVLLHTRAIEDSVAIVFDRPDVDDERQIVYERMDWTHPHRRGYYEKNKAFIASAPSSLADALAGEDPIQVMFNGGVQPMRLLVRDLRAAPIAERYSVAITEYELRDFSLVDVTSPLATTVEWREDEPESAVWARPSAPAW